MGVITPIIIGIFLPKIFEVFNILVGQPGVDYYGEVHSTFHNSMVHTIFMPFTIYGMLLWIPQTLIYIYQWDKLDKKIQIKRAIDIQYFFYIVYMTHYLTINIGIGLILMYVYAYPLQYGVLYYKECNTSNVIKRGLAISIISLIIQEIFGHYMSDDEASRPEAVFNAILYATYFSIGHIFR